MAKDDFKAMPPKADWNLTQEVMGDLGDIHRRLTECRTSFGLLLRSNRPIRVSDINNINETLSLAEQVANMTFMYLLDNEQDDFYRRLDEIDAEVQRILHDRKEEMKQDLLIKIKQFMRKFYYNCMKSGVWIKTDYSAMWGRKKGAF